MCKTKRIKPFVIFRFPPVANHRLATVRCTVRELLQAFAGFTRRWVGGWGGRLFIPREATLAFRPVIIPLKTPFSRHLSLMFGGLRTVRTPVSGAFALNGARRQRPRQPLLVPVAPGDTSNLERGQRAIKEIKAGKSG